MSRYIDVDKFIEDLGFENTEQEREENIGEIVTLDDFDRQPTEDVIKVVRCKDCIYFQDRYIELPDGSKRPYKKGESGVPLSVGINVGSYCTRIDYAIVHGYRHGEPSVDETRLWTKPDDFCSYGERKDEKR